MTAYAVAVSGATAPQLSVTPGATFPVRIARIEVCGIAATSAGTSSLQWQVAMYPGSTVSSGTVLTPTPMRMGTTPAATAVAKSGGSISGTNIVLHSEQQESFQPSTTAGINPVVVNSNYQFAFDLVLVTGATLVVSGTETNGSFTTVVVYFEELRENWSS